MNKFSSAQIEKPTTVLEVEEAAVFHHLHHASIRRPLLRDLCNIQLVHQELQCRRILLQNMDPLHHQHTKMSDLSLMMSSLEEEANDAPLVLFPKISAQK